MMKSIYIDWDNGRVVANPDKWIKERAEDIEEDPDKLNEFLHQVTNLAELFNMTTREHEELRDDWRNECLEFANEEFDVCFEEYDLEAMEAEEFEEE